MNESLSNGMEQTEGSLENSGPLLERGVLVAIWMATLLLLCVVAAFSYVQLQNIRQQQLATVESTLSNLTRVNEEHATRTFHSAEQALQFMISEYAEEGTTLDLKSLVDRGVIDGGMFAQVGIMNALGIFRFGNMPLTPDMDWSDREHFRVHLISDTKELFISKPMVDQVSGKPLIQLTRRINQPDGSFGGVAVVSIDAHYFSRFYAGLELPAQSLATLVGLDGVIRARQLDGKATSGESVLPEGQMLRLVQRNSSGIYTGFSPIDGVERVYAYRKISGYPLVVITGFAWDRVWATFLLSRNALITQAAALCLLLLGMAGSLTFYTLRLKSELAKRHRIATELRASDESLKMALLGGELGAWSWNLNDEKFTHNAQLSALIGYQSGELNYGKGSFAALIHPDDLGAFFAGLRLHLKGESENFKSEFRLRHKQGDWIWINLMSKVVSRDRLGRAVRLSGTAQDVTSRVNTSRSLAESDERWDTAISGSNEGIWDWNLITRKMYVSMRMLEILGYPSSESGSTIDGWDAYIHPDDLVGASQKLGAHFKAQAGFYVIEMRLRTQDDSYKWVMIRGRAVYDEAGRAVRVAGSASDSTEQRLVREWVQDQNAQLSAIFSLSPDAFVSFDQRFKVKYTNDAFEQLTGLAPVSIMGLSEKEFTEKVNQLCAPVNPFHGFGNLRESQGSNDRTRSGVIELSSPVRRVLQAKLKTSQSASVSQILYLRDITHETIVEEMKTEFLSTAAHELRTPMASVLGFAEVLLTHQLDEAQRREFTDIILTQSQQMSFILDELLDLARIEARREKDFVFETLNLQAVVQEVLKGFKLPTDRACPAVAIPGMLFSGDRGKAGQAILNVLSNAYKYSLPGGQVAITAVETFSETKGALLGICIRDHGIGMKKEHLERIFERFYRADASGRTQGTGLGMSIVKEIMEIHGGSVMVDSTAGQGTSVTLLFPAICVEVA